MQQKPLKEGFTLSEILVVIVIIMIMAVGVSNFDFNRITQKQKAEIHSVKLVSIIEEVRDNALIGKAILDAWELKTPGWWRIQIDIDGSNNGTLSTYYSILWDFSDEINVDSLYWESEQPFTLQTLECQNINGWAASSISSWMSIWFIGSKMELYCDSTTLDSTDKILNIDYGIGTLSKNITLNTLTWVIEID